MGKASVRAKHAAERELRANNFMFSFLKPVTNAFNIELWAPSCNKFDDCELFTKKISRDKWGRVIKTSEGDYFYLTN